MKKVRKGFSEKRDGSMHLSVLENALHRKQFFEVQGLTGRQIAMADVVHGTHVEVVTAASPYILPATDALVTSLSDILLTLTGADCFPVYFENKRAGVIGLAHCGWRGIVAGIIGETITALTSIGGKVDDITMTIGPGICARHFEIGEDTLPAFAGYQEFVRHDTAIHVDLRGIIRHQAVAKGVSTKNVIDTDECTYCLSPKYYSCRRDHPKTIEAQLAYIVQFPHRKF